MSNVVVALILNRNRLLISKLLSGQDRGKWSFPSGPVNTNETDFTALKKAIKTNLDIDVFPYQTIARLRYDLPTEEKTFTLIKCAVSDETKASLRQHIPSKYKWIYLFNTPYTDLTDFDKKLHRYLVKHKSGIPVKRLPPGFKSMRPEKRKLIASMGGSRGFASMTPEQRQMIASRGGKKAHALGKAHRFTSEEARRAGKIGGKGRHYPTH